MNIKKIGPRQATPRSTTGFSPKMLAKLLIGALWRIGLHLLRTLDSRPRSRRFFCRLLPPKSSRFTNKFNAKKKSTRNKAVSWLIDFYQYAKCHEISVSRLLRWGHFMSVSQQDVSISSGGSRISQTKGGCNPWVWGKNILFGSFLPKYVWKWKKLDRGRGR